MRSSNKLNSTLSIKRNEELRQRVADEANNICFSSHTLPIFIAFSWKDKKQLRKSQVIDLAIKIVKMISENIPIKDQHEIQLDYEILRKIGLSDYLHAINISLKEDRRK